MSLTINLTRPIGAIVVGRAGMDLYPTPEGTKIESAGHFDAEIGGSAGNIAVAIARQGVRAILVGPLSADPVGTFVRSALEGYGVDTSRCRAIGGDHRTSLALAETRSNDAEVVIYRNGAADLQLRKEDADAGLIGTASVLIVTGTAFATEPSRSAALGFLAIARETGTFSILDIDHRPYSWATTSEAQRLYLAGGRLCNAVVGNDDEFTVVAGARHKAFDAAADFVKDGADFVIFKKGMAGSVTLTAEGEFATEAFPVAVKKPFGPGDAFMGGLIAGLLDGRPLSESATRASASAALVVSRRGCASAMPTRAEIDALIASRTKQ